MPDSPASQPGASIFARYGLLAYCLLIVYASWYPFSGWRNTGLPPLAFLWQPFPYYWTGFDLMVNIAGYIPLGMLLVFALYPQVRGIAAVLLAMAVGMLMSAGMETVQNFLPTRVASNLDLATNAAGAAIGAVAGGLLTRTFLQESRILLLRQRWFTGQASRGLLVLGLWPLAQLYPQAFLFGHGQWLPILSEWLSLWWETPIDLGSLLRGGATLDLGQYWLAETIVTSCGLAGAMLALLSLAQAQAPRLALVAALALAVLACKTLAFSLLFTPANAMAWLTPGARGGLVIGALLLIGSYGAPPRVQRRLAALILLISLAVVNLVPANPYFESTLQSWVQGKFLNFNGAARFLSLAWPLFALWALLHPGQRVKQ